MRVILVRNICGMIGEKIVSGILSVTTLIDMARALYLSRFCIHGLDRSSDVFRVLSHMTLLYMQCNLQGSTLQVDGPRFSHRTSAVTILLWKGFSLAFT